MIKVSGSTYHSDLQSFDVKLPDLPVAQNVAKDFNKSIDPEDGSHDEKEYNPTVLLNAGEKQKLFSDTAAYLSVREMAVCH